MTHQPFSVFKRKDRPYFLVRYKDEKTGKYTSSVNTRQTDKNAAIKTAWEWYKNGLPEKNVPVKTFTLLDLAKKTPITKSEAEEIIDVLQKQGLIKAAIMTDSKQDVELETFLLNFWDYDSSPYIREKLRKNHGIHRKYCAKQYGAIKNHWLPAFKGRLLGSFTRRDLDDFITHFEDSNLTANGKNALIQAGTIALSWAYKKELIEKDVTQGIVWFSGKAQKRHILSPEVVRKLFLVTWNDNRYKLANMLSMVTGLRAGEIQGLRLQDLGEECVYVSHSWNMFDKLKTTKNNENRIAEVPFPHIMQAVKNLALSNPHGQGQDGYVFYATIPDKPIETYGFLSELRLALQKTGMSEEEAKAYTFHSWRHYFTSYMKDQIHEKILRQQTGHKTITMLEHYAEHEISGERQQLRLAQIKTFSEFVPEDIITTFERGKVKQYS